MNKLKTLSGAQLKYIAFTTMLIDHVNKALIYPNLNGGILLVISDIFDILGRIAFPIFIFLLIEGYFRTTNRWKYLGIMSWMRPVGKSGSAGTYRPPHLSTARIEAIISVR